MYIYIYIQLDMFLYIAKNIYMPGKLVKYFLFQEAFFLYSSCIYSAPLPILPGHHPCSPASYHGASRQGSHSEAV